MGITTRLWFTIFSRFLWLIILICCSLLIATSGYSGKTYQRHNFIFRRSDNPASLGINSTSAPILLPVSSSVSESFVTISSSSGFGQVLSSSSSQRPSTFLAISSSVSSSLSSHFSSPSQRPHLLSTEVLSLAFRTSSTGAQSLTPLPSVNTSPFTFTTPTTPASSITQPTAISAVTTPPLSDDSAITSSYIFQSPNPTSEITSPSINSSALKSSSFWRKKGAIAAIFVSISFMIVAIVALLIVHYMKRRNIRKHARLHEELFEKYSEPDHRSSSPGPSINGVPMDAFAARDVPQENSFLRGDTSMATRNIVRSSFPVQHPDYYNPNSSRYLAPSQLQALARNPTQASLQDGFHPQRDSRVSYQQSIDSFYGVAGQLSSYNA